MQRTRRASETGSLAAAPEGNWTLGHRKYTCGPSILGAASKWHTLELSKGDTSTEQNLRWKHKPNLLLTTVRQSHICQVLSLAQGRTPAISGPGDSMEFRNWRAVNGYALQAGLLGDTAVDWRSEERLLG